MGFPGKQTLRTTAGREGKRGAEWGRGELSWVQLLKKPQLAHEGLWRCNCPLQFSSLNPRIGPLFSSVYQSLDGACPLRCVAPGATLGEEFSYEICSTPNTSGASGKEHVGSVGIAHHCVSYTQQTHAERTNTQGSLSSATMCTVYCVASGTYGSLLKREESFKGNLGMY